MAIQYRASPGSTLMSAKRNHQQRNTHLYRSQPRPRYARIEINVLVSKQEELLSTPLNRSWSNLERVPLKSGSTACQVNLTCVAVLYLWLQ